MPYTVVTLEDWGGIGGCPLGQWIADQRHAHGAGTLEAGRVAELEWLGMVRSEQETAWADGIAVTREYTAVHGHFLLPTTATIRSGCGRRTPARLRAGRGRTRSSGRPVVLSGRRPVR